MARPPWTSSSTVSKQRRQRGRYTDGASARYFMPFHDNSTPRGPIAFPVTTRRLVSEHGQPGRSPAKTSAQRPRSDQTRRTDFSVLGRRRPRGRRNQRERLFRWIVRRPAPAIMRSPCARPTTASPRSGTGRLSSRPFAGHITSPSGAPPAPLRGQRQRPGNVHHRHIPAAPTGVLHGQLELGVVTTGSRLRRRNSLRVSRLHDRAATVLSGGTLGVTVIPGQGIG